MQIRSSKQGFFKPAQDWWAVNGQKFSSTKEMLESLPNDTYDATYHFSPEKPDEPTPPTSVSSGVVLGAAAGAGLVAVGGAVVNFAGEALGMLTMGFAGPGQTLGLGVAALAVGAGLGAAVGGGIAHSRIKNWKPPSAEESAQMRRGSLQIKDGEKTFYVGHSLKAGVDLKAYAKAQELPEGEKEPEVGRRGWALRTGAGFAASAVPVFGWMAAAGVGSALGSRVLSDETTGELVGGAFGALASATVLSAGQTFGPAGYFGTALGVGVLGAAGGALLADRADENRKTLPPKEMETQWWS